MDGRLQIPVYCHRGAGFVFVEMAGLVVVGVVRGAAGFRRVAVDFRGAAVGYFRVARGAGFVAEAVVALLVRLALKLAALVAPGLQLAGFRGLAAAGAVPAFRGLVVHHVPDQVCCVGCAAGMA